MADPLSVSASALGIVSFAISLCSGVVQFYSTVRGARQDIETMLDSTQTLQSMMSRTKETLDRLQLEDTTSSHPVLESLRTCVAGLNRLHKKLGKVKVSAGDSRIRALAFSLQYAFKESTILKLKNLTGELIRNLSLAMTLLNLDTSISSYHALMEGFPSIENNLQNLRAETQTGLQSLERAIHAAPNNSATGNDDRRIKVLKWMSTSVAVEDAHLEAVQQRETDTGNWFLHSDKYSRWKQGLGSWLWMYGKAGCGKTILCSTVISDVRQFCISRQNHHIAYFYFSFNSVGRQSTKIMLRSVFSQILHGLLSVPDIVLDLHTAYKPGEPPQSALLNAFRVTLQSIGPTYIILDGLDECPAVGGERTRLIGMLANWKKFALSNLHLLVTSRLEKDLEEISQLMNMPAISMESSAINRDISMYIHNQIKTDPKLCHWPADIKVMVETEVTNGANGMFRWVACQLESVRKCLRPSDVRQTLNKLPKTLDETYERMLTNIDEDYHDLARYALTWLSFSERPLKLTELAEAVVIDPSAIPAFGVAGRLFDPDNVLNFLSGLVTVDRAGTIQLAHYSVKEYLTSNRAARGPAARFYILQCDADNFIAESCLHYINIVGQFVEDLIEKRSDGPPDLSSARKVPETDYPLLEYALRYVFEHAKRVDDHLTQSLKNTLLNFFRTSEKPQLFSDAIGNYACVKIRSRRIDSGSSVYHAAGAGLASVTEALIQEGVDPNEGPGDYGYPLQHAAYKGNSMCVAVLLRKGANVNAQGGKLYNALFAATHAGNAQIVRQLLDNGAIIGMAEHPVLSAVRGHSESQDDLASSVHNQDWAEIIELLLERGASATHTNMSDQSLLRWAVIAGLESTVRALMHHMFLDGEKCDFWPENRDRSVYEMPSLHRFSYSRHTSAAYQAVFCAHSTIAKMLIEKWDNVHEKDFEGRTALYWACFHNLVIPIRALIDAGASVHTVGPYGWTPMYWAYMHNNEEIVRLLEAQCLSRLSMQGSASATRFAVGSTSAEISQAERDTLCSECSESADRGARDRLRGILG